MLIHSMFKMFNVPRNNKITWCIDSFGRILDMVVVVVLFILIIMDFFLRNTMEFCFEWDFHKFIFEISECRQIHCAALEFSSNQKFKSRKWIRICTTVNLYLIEYLLYIFTKEEKRIIVVVIQIIDNRYTL